MIGIFDSGSGGLTVLRALRERAPLCDVVYFADLANMPYGNKTQDALRELTHKAITVLISHGAKQIISACNSVSMQVLTTLSKELHDDGIEIIEMVTPTTSLLSRRVLDNKETKILLVATQATLHSDIYKNAFAERGIEIEQIAIPPLAEAIEKNAGDAEIQDILYTYLHSAISYKPDIVILGCTQYPLVKKLFEDFFAKNNISPLIFDPAAAVAEEAIKKFNTEGSGDLAFFVSKESQHFRRLVSDLFPNSGKHSIVVETL